MTPARPGGSRAHLLGGEGLTSLQIFWLTVTARLTTVIAGLPTLTASRAGRDAWLAFLASLPLGMAFAWVMAYVSGVDPRSGLSGLARRALGRVGGAVVTLVFAWSYLHLAGILVRNYAEAVVAAVLPTTPLVVVAVLVGLVAATMAGQDTAVVGRLSLVLGPVAILSVLPIAVFVLPNVDPGMLKPIFHSGWRGLASGTLSATMWHTVAFFYPAVVWSVADPERGKRGLLTGVASAGLLSAFLAALVVATLSSERAVQEEFPLFSVARLVMVGEFIQRVDALALAAWGLSLLMAAALFLHTAALSLADLFGVGGHRRLVKPVALLVVVIAMIAAANTWELKAFFDPRVLGPYVTGHIWVPTAAWVAGARLHGRAAGRAGDGSGRG